MYKLSQLMYGEEIPSSAIRLSDNTSIPFAVGNNLYSYFKQSVQGLLVDYDKKPIPAEELQDQDGNVMTKEQVSSFVKKLP